MTKLIIIRGLPGSGKSTLAKTFIEYQHIEADQFFMHGGIYKFNFERLQAAHRYCKSQAEYYLNQGISVVVSNTFTTLKEIKVYIELAKEYKVEYQIIECKGEFGSVHSIPDEVYNHMKFRWQELK